MFRFLLTKLFAKREKMKNEDVKPFLDHLEDLRGTIFKMAFTLVASVSVCFIWNSELFYFLQLPLRVNGLDPKEVLVSHEVIGPFMASLTVSFYAGMTVSFPVLIYFLGEFILPAMTPREKKYALPAVVIGFVLFLLGAWFCFYYIVPGMVKFLSAWGAERGIKTQYAVGNYFKLVTLMCLVFGLLCQIPVVMISLHGVGIVTYAWIKSTRLYAYASILVLCGVVSPAPDIPSLVMITLPIMALYEICIWIIFLLEKRQKPPESNAVVSVAAAAAAMPYGDVRSDHDSGHHSDPHHYEEPSHLSDDPSHYSDGHYHDDHYHREHPELRDEPKTEPEQKIEPEPKPDAEKASEPEKHVDATPKPEDKPPENKEPGT